MYVLAKGKDISQKITVSEATKRWQLSAKDIDGNVSKDNVFGIYCQADNTSICNNLLDGNSHEQVIILWGTDAPVGVVLNSNHYVNGTAYPQISLQGITGCKISGEVIEACLGNGILCDYYAAAPCNNIYISDVQIDDCATAAIWLKVANNSCINGFNISNCYNGIVVETGSYINISNGQVTLCDECGIHGLGLSYSTITNVYSYNNGWCGIILRANGATQSLYNRIMQCFLYDNQGAPTQNRGLEEIDSSDYNQVYFNTAYGNTDGQITIIGANSTQGNNITW